MARSRPLTRPLTAQQRRFVELLVADPTLSPTAAYRQAYPRATQKSAEEASSRLSRDVRVAALLDASRTRVLARAESKADRVLRELDVVGFSSVAHYQIADDGHVELTDGAPRSAIRAVSSIKRTVKRFAGGETITTEIRLWPKVEALRLRGQVEKLFTGDKGDGRDEPGVLILPPLQIPQPPEGMTTIAAVTTVPRAQLPPEKEAALARLRDYLGTP